MQAPVKHVARIRRHWYGTHAALRRTLQRPVISVGSVEFGGSGKTPAVVHLAQMLMNMGERPSILSRGYGRAVNVEGVVLVSDARGIRSDLARAGDEPLMLARRLPGVSVLVSQDRYLGGRLAEEHLNCTVHLLDDGFQHLRLSRQVDIVMLSHAHLRRPDRPARESITAANTADAVVVSHALTKLPDEVRGPLPHPMLFSAAVTTAEPHLLEPLGRPFLPKAETPVLVVAAIARAERFMTDVKRAGFVVNGQLLFRDHHRFSARDVDEIVRGCERGGAHLVLTTEKDAVRLLPHRPLPVKVAWLPISLTIEPHETFRSWLIARLESARRGSS